VKLSAEAIEVCKQNYKNNCSRCPIRPACVATVGHGQEGLDEWIRKVNEVAEKVSFKHQHLEG
jgi:N-acetylglutamate synthase/N-acetylornithine aminotransferase